MSANQISRAYNLIILDESGSMESIKNATISGFNEIMQTIETASNSNPSLEQYINFWSFSGASIKEQIALSQADKQLKLDGKSYQPNNSTPLYDAIGLAVTSLRKALEKEKDFAVLVTILTDGEENASKEYSFKSIAALIQSLKEQQWIFSYMGANHDVERVAKSLNIMNSMRFDATEADTSRMLRKDMNSRMAAYSKISSGKLGDIQQSYFED